MAGYDPAKAPDVRVAGAAEKGEGADQRGGPGARTGMPMAAKIADIAGWTVTCQQRNSSTEEPAATAKALELLQEHAGGNRARRARKPRSAELQKVPLWISPGVSRHRRRAPSIIRMPDWLRAQRPRSRPWPEAWSSPTCRIFDAEMRRMPNFALHELAHAYHDRVLGFESTAVIASPTTKPRPAANTTRWSAAMPRAKSPRDRAYAMTNHKEYFAESTEAFFGTNDFFPFTRDELRAARPGDVRAAGKALESRQPK